MTFRAVSAAAPLTPLLTGPPTSGSIVAVFRSAALIAVTGSSGDHGGPRTVALLSLQASGSPNGVRIPLAAAQRPFAGIRVGSPVLLGAREIVTDADRYRLARTWRTAVPQIRASADAVAIVRAHAGDPPLGIPHSRIAILATAIAGSAHSGDGLRPAVRALVGLGKGLTPGGDDVLAGLLVGLRATGQRLALQRVRHCLGSDVAERTTAVSVDLLRLAAAGHASLEVLRLLGAIHAVRLDPDCELHRALLLAAVDGVLGLGHTSGADLLAGLLLGLTTHPVPPATVPRRLILAGAGVPTGTTRRAAR